MGAVNNSVHNAHSSECKRDKLGPRACHLYDTYVWTPIFATAKAALDKALVCNYLTGHCRNKYIHSTFQPVTSNRKGFFSDESFAEIERGILPCSYCIIGLEILDKVCGYLVFPYILTYVLKIKNYPLKAVRQLKVMLGVLPIACSTHSPDTDDMCHDHVDVFVGGIESFIKRMSSSAKRTTFCKKVIRCTGDEQEWRSLQPMVKQE